MAAAACRRGLLLHHHHWQQQVWAGPGARSISQLVKTNGRHAFLVDTLALVRKLESQGVPTKQPEAITSAITEVLNDSLESISESFVSKAEMQKSEMLQESNICKFKSQVQSSQRALEEKKASRAQLKNQEKIAMQKVQEKYNTLEMYTKACEKLLKHSSKISALQEQAAAAKAAEKEVKALKAKITDQNLEIHTLAPKIVEWQRNALETEERLKAKEKERDQRIADNSRKMAALKSEMECKHQSLEDRERKVGETIAV